MPNPDQKRHKKGYLLAKKIGTIVSLVFGSKPTTPQQQQSCLLSTKCITEGVDRRRASRKQTKNESAVGDDRLYGAIKRSTGFDIKRWKAGKRSKKWRQGEDGGLGIELCKKRILMGEKCRALNGSGVLHYGEDGILLPEDVLLND